MLRKSRLGHVARAACAFGLVVAAYPAFQQANSVVVAAEVARSERDLETVFRSVSNGASTDAQVSNKVKKDVLRNALNSQALASVLQKNDSTGSSEWMELAGQVSRRSPHYLAAELLDAAEGQDVERLVIAFDRMASLNPSVREKLFSVAVSILDTPDGAELLAKRQSRPWFTHFVTTAARQPDRVDQVAAFLTTAKISDENIRRRLLTAVVAKFVLENKVAQAQEFAAAFGRIGDFDWNSLNFRSSNQTLEDIPLVWRFPNPDAKPEFDANGDLKFVISPGVGPEPLAEKVLLFAPGRHRLETTLKVDDAPGGTFIAWKILCGALPIRQVSGIVNKANGSRKSIELEFVAIEQCKGYSLSLLLTAPSGQFDQMKIEIADPIVSSEF